MQERLAELKSAHLTKVVMRVKPSEPTQDVTSHESFKVLNSHEDMGLAKQIVIESQAGSRVVAFADQISKPSDTQADFYE